jgi:Polysaccharide lyase family 4, domain III
VILDDSAFSGGFRNKSGRYHGRTATWIYGQGTPYNTMTANFDLDSVPQSQAYLNVAGVDSEDPAKVPIRIIINGAVIYEGPDPLPNDSRSGPGGPGNWGSYTWEIGAGILQQGANSLSITNLDPSDKINYPIFFMLDYATITWGQ